jgi:hypothetical protein
VARRKARRPTSAPAGREPHRIDRAGRQIEAIATPLRFNQQAARQSTPVGADRRNKQPSGVPALRSQDSLADLAKRVRDEHAAVLRSAENVVRHVLAAGRALLAAKASVPHGQWTDWLACDRAAVVTTALLQILRTAPPDQQRRAIEECLRDEFADVARTALNEIRPEDG